MEIGVIGINELVKPFCRHWIKRGHKILFADLELNSEAYSFAEGLGSQVTLALPRNVARIAEVIVLAVPRKDLLSTIRVMGDVQQKIIIDLITEEHEPLHGREFKTSFEEINELLPNAKLVKITARYPAYLFEESKANTLYTFSNDNLAQRLIHWFTDGLGYKLVDLQSANHLNQSK